MMPKILESKVNARKMLLGVLILLAAFFLLILSTKQILWIISIPLLIAGLSLILEAGHRRQPELPLLAVASLGYATIYLLIQTIPSLWYLFQQTSLFLSYNISTITKTALLLGPTTSGLWILLLFYVFLSSSFLLIPQKSQKDILWFIECIGGLLLLWILYIGILSVVPFSTNTEPIRFHPLFFSLCLIPTVLYYLRYPFKEPISNVSPLKRKGKMLHENGRSENCN